MSKEEWIERINRGERLYDAPKILCEDKDVIRAAVTQTGIALIYASETLKNDEEIVRTAITQDANALAYASERLKDNEDIVRIAVSKNPYTIMHASDRLKRNKDIVCLAVSKNVDALQVLPDELRDGVLLRTYIQEQITLRENTQRLPKQLKHVSTSSAERPSSRLLQQPQTKAAHMFNTINGFLSVTDANWEIIKQAAANMGIVIPPHLRGGKKSRQKRRNKRKSRRYK